MELLKNDESLEDLQLCGLKLIQKTDGFRFGVDAVLLSDFAKTLHSVKTLDLCTGSAVVPILLSAKTNTKEFCALEIQDEICEMAQRCVSLNGLDDKIKVQQGDLKESDKIYSKRVFDLITCNPPYMPVGSAVTNPSDSKIIARHEVMCNLEDVICASAKLLKQKGHLVLVHKPTRLADIICLMRKYEIEPKRIRFAHKAPDTEPSLVLVDGAYKGGIELRIMPPLFMYNEDGTETDELKRIYGK
ncbi:MAG: tRNA1(Val) (adenine(37)-N6)-methyltransferase [Ruminococcaceae bacterium]|nr:tRNA1(Val) (adenine(37)-N6)-methyltransferase [Oscillospiraceae bacterium]